MLTPAKSDAVNGISARDASLVLRHAAGLTNLTGFPALAADVTRDGAIDAMDAFYILQKAVGLIQPPFPGAGAVWSFSPTNRLYPNLSANQAGQDFTAVLLGEVSGNWSTTAAGMMSKRDLITPEVVVGTDDGPPGGQQRTARVLLKTTNAVVYGVDISLSYTPTNRAAAEVRLGRLGENLASAINTNEPGLVLASLAAAVPLAGDGSLLELSFAGEEPVTWHLDRITINEGATTVQVETGNASFDTDGDGLVDCDETDLFKTDPRRADSDGDRMPDGAEIRAGTDPNDRTSYLGINGANRETDGSLVLTFRSGTGKRYQVEYRTALGTAIWQPLGAVIHAAGPSTTVRDQSASQGSRFYRVRLVESY